jgi:glycosyltransferase involved in cell wall biosynthesis
MRILHILNHTFRQNGNVHAAIDLACAQAAMGHQVAVCSGGGSFDALMQARGVEVLELNQSRKLGNLLMVLPRLIALLRRWRPDVVHAHMMTSAVLAWTPTRLFRLPLVTTVHNEFEKSAILMGLGDRVIAVSQAVATAMKRRGLSASRTHVVLNGTIGSARHPQPPPPPADLHHPAVVYVGGLHPRKGVADLIDAMLLVHAQAPETHLYLVGEGPCLDEYRARTRGCPNIHFLGAHSDPRPYLLAADVFVLASHFDPAPLVISEAREAGCAIVATRVDGIPQLLDAGLAGVLVAPRDPEGLAAAIRELVTDPAKLSTVRAASQINISNLSVNRVAAETMKIYRMNNSAMKQSICHEENLC